jgi:hypothetical protein
MAWATAVAFHVPHGVVTAAGRLTTAIPVAVHTPQLLVTEASISSAVTVPEAVAFQVPQGVVIEALVARVAVAVANQPP